MKIIIVDDETQIREGLKILLKQIDDVEVVGEASNIADFMQLITQVTPDLVFLDIQLKNATGFDLLDALSAIQFRLIFVTAYNEYAIKAFKYNAFDYLLKPIDPDELYKTVERLQHQNAFEQEQMDALKVNSDFEKIVIKTTEQMYVLLLNDIVRCEADKGYTHFYLKDNQHVLSSKPLKEYNNLLPEKQFIRVHQSHLVNWKYIISYCKKGTLLLKNGTVIPVSVRKRHVVTSLLKN